MKLHNKLVVPKSTSFSQLIPLEDSCITISFSNYEKTNKMLHIFKLKNGDYKVRVKLL